MRLLPRHLVALFALTAPLATASCMAPPEAPPEQVEVTDDAIINGQADTTHTAVVAVLGNNFSCSGTIIQVKNGHGYVLTAAHCCVPGSLPNQVVIGNNYNTGQSFSVVGGSVKRDGCYEDCPGSTNDVCMLQFNGATGSTPVIPVMTPQNDNLAIGTSITYVGYGITASPPGGFNSTRRRVTKTIGHLDEFFVEYANASQSGTCEGDSGGPGLVTVGGTEFVASVTSFGDQNCTALGSSIRSKSVYTNFIAPYLADQNPINAACPVETDCQVCLSDSTNQQCGGGCASALNACANNNECGALLDCYQGCGTLACQNDCNTAHVGGLQQYEEVMECICDSACDTACGTNAFCTNNRCGTKPSMATPECKACAEGNCCAEAWSCFDSTDCKKCFTSQAGPECATNQLALDYYQCVTQNCGSSCTLKDPTMTTTSSTTTSSTDAVTTTGAGGNGAGGMGGAPPATTGAGGKQTHEVTECACQNAGSGDVPAWPWVVGFAGVGAALMRRRPRVTRS